MNKIKKARILIIWIILIISFQPDYCTAQTQTIASTKSIKYRNWDITLNGKVKSIMIITHKPDYSCDTIKAYPGNDLYESVPQGEIWLNICHSDTLIYSFDQDLVLSKIIKIDYAVHAVAFYVHKETEYNFENGLLMSVTSKKEGASTIIASYKYDSNKNVILKREFLKNVKIREYYKYDNNDNLIKTKQYNLYKYEIFPKRRNTDTYEYDSNGNLIKEDKGNLSYINFFKYDSLGNKIEEGYDYSTKRKKYPYTPSQGFVYDSNNRLIKSFSIGKGKLYRTETYYEYDNEGREIDVKIYKISNDTVLDYHWTKEYNEKGELIKEESNIGSGTHFSPKYIQCKKKITTYDNYGNITQIELFNSNQFEVKIYRYVYTYDSYGNWIKREEFEGESEETLVRIQIEDRIIEYY